MRTLLILASIVACSVAPADVPKPEPSRGPPAELSPEEAVILKAKEKKEHDEAMARLPLLTPERIQQILDALQDIRYPIGFDVLCEKLGGQYSLVWCCTRSRIHEHKTKRTSTYFVASDATDYELVVDFVESPIGQRPTMVGRARLCYNSPLGWRFEAESSDDFFGAGVPEKKPNRVAGSD